MPLRRIILRDFVAHQSHSRHQLRLTPQILGLSHSGHLVSIGHQTPRKVQELAGKIRVEEKISRSSHGAPGSLKTCASIKHGPRPDTRPPPDPDLRFIGSLFWWHKNYVQTETS
jgi:hypothetical protein